ncbi:uncharacterized protein EDB91DRAFT_212124 [Suillus paluster]|uniref:uncharacterized protein n=1 Tax=Suillus paluster TaxID=48578 RepID=UPI001B86DE88|nr:uncharacterized protein EDB91DRAFT_212124 [Suillus paluster]KAG1744142.1 hypothetical protein EDB91DRAFT_212124 [Suillus paluster]
MGEYFSFFIVREMWDLVDVPAKGRPLHSGLQDSHCTLPYVAQDSSVLERVAADVSYRRPTAGSCSYILIASFLECGPFWAILPRSFQWTFDWLHPSFHIRTLRALPWTANTTCGFDKPGAFVYLAGTPAICGDRVVALYYFSEYHSPEGASTMSMLVIDWRKGHLKRHPLCERGGLQVTFHLVDERTMVTVGSEGRMTVYTLQGPDGEPQRQFAYLLPNMNPGIHVIYATPLFHGVAARPDLMPSYVPSLESQIMVLEVLTNSWPVIVVIDMVIFSEKAIQSATSVDIPWSDWGPKYTCCFPHHPSHRISVFGSKMAYALPSK